MIRAQIRSLHSPDVPNLAEFQPVDPGEFGFLLQMRIGPRDAEGEESFDVLVCSPKWIQKQYEKDAVISGRHHLLMLEWDFDRLKGAIHGFCDPLTGSTWEDLASKLGRFGKWEFEDYREPETP